MRSISSRMSHITSIELIIDTTRYPSGDTMKILADKSCKQLPISVDTLIYHFSKNLWDLWEFPTEISRCILGRQSRLRTSAIHSQIITLPCLPPRSRVLWRLVELTGDIFVIL